MRKLKRFLASTCLFFVVGCGTSDDRQRVTGKVHFPDGDIRQLDGHSVELAHTTDPTIRATGTIGVDGSFIVESLENGTVRKGTKPGTYKVRLVFNEEAKRPALPARYAKFESSGWQMQVPSQGEVTLTVRAK